MRSEVWGCQPLLFVLVVLVVLARGKGVAFLVPKAFVGAFWHGRGCGDKELLPGNWSLGPDLNWWWDGFAIRCIGPLCHPGVELCTLKARIRRSGRESGRPPGSRTPHQWIMSPLL